MTNKKRIRKLINKKYKSHRKITLFTSYTKGWDFAVQFRDDQIKDFPTPNWHREYMNLPPVQPDLPGLRHYVRQLEKTLRNIPVYSAEFHRMAQELRKAREDLQALIMEKKDKFERIEYKFFSETKGLIFPLITKYLF